MVDTNTLCVTIVKVLSTALVRTSRHYFLFFYPSKVFSQGGYEICSRLDRGDAVSDKPAKALYKPPVPGSSGPVMDGYLYRLLRIYRYGYDIPGPNASQTKKPTPQGPTRPSVFAAASNLCLPGLVRVLSSLFVASRKK